MRKLGFLNLREILNHAAAVVARAQGLDLAVAKEVGNLRQLLRRFQRRGVVGFKVVAVGTVKGVNVPQTGMVSLVDDLQGLVVSRRNEGSAGFALVEKLLFGHLAGFGVMGDEDDLDVLIARAQEAVEQKKETARQVFFHRVHGAGGVHDAEHDGVRLAPDFRHRMMVMQIVLVKRKTLACKAAMPHVGWPSCV